MSDAVYEVGEAGTVLAVTEIDEPAAAAPPRAFDPSDHPDRLNLGCGWDKRPGYLNVDFQDFHDPDLVADVRHLDQLPSGHYREVVAQDVLEHLERADTQPALREWARLLQTGGTLVLRVPDILGVAAMLSQDRTIERQEELVQCLFGTQAYTGDYHHAGFTELLLRLYLADAGFDDVQVDRTDWLFDIVARRADGPVEADLRELRFMDLRWGPLSLHARAASLLAEAREHTDLGGLDPGPTRLRRVKAMVLRTMRIATHHQAAHNRAMEEAVEALAQEIDHRRT